jgi:NAD+ dependent glucose-6-phosphate dehydrogenase
MRQTYILPVMTPIKVLITGVCGTLGGALHRVLTIQPEFWDVYGTDRRHSVREELLPEWKPIILPERLSVGDLAEMEFAVKVVSGMDMVVHLAAEANPGSAWENIHRCNMVSTYNVYEACRLANVKRILFASSIRISFGYLSAEPYYSLWDKPFTKSEPPVPCITHEMPIWPSETYGASKAWGEALGRVFALRHKISCICLRFGGISPRNVPLTPAGPEWSGWCSLGDYTHMMVQCLQAPAAVRFDIFYAVSNNQRLWVDIKHAREIVGYNPKDRAEDK